MTLRIYNTLTRRTENFQPLEPGKVTMYVCGPTVYGGAHVGHGMSSLVFDIVRRYLMYRGFEVRHAMNYTDVDDRIIAKANQEGEAPLELAERYIQEYDQQLKALNVLPATVYPRATAEIPYIIDMVARLLDSDAAYIVDGDVYYRVEKDKDYGKLSGRKLEDMHAGARIDVDARKEHPMDFAVWKSAKPGEPSWDSPWRPGRPGWHIECSAMVFHHLGQQIDIHGGGNDLIFPHHENEIAQSESLTGKPFARYWMHNGLMQFSGEKMSRSVGNLVSIKEFLANHEPDVLRMMVLNSSYRHPLTYGDEVVEAAARGLERLRSGIRPALPGASGASKSDLAALNKLAEDTQTGFIAAMDDDFNTAAVLGLLFELVRQINQARESGANDQQLYDAQSTLRELGGVLGLRLLRQEKQVDPEVFRRIVTDLRANLAKEKITDIQMSLTNDGQEMTTSQLIDFLVLARDALRARKLWKVSDQIRDQLAEQGVLVEDSAGGSSWRWE